MPCQNKIRHSVAEILQHLQDLVLHPIYSSLTQALVAISDLRANLRNFKNLITTMKGDSKLRIQISRIKLDQS